MMTIALNALRRIHLETIGTYAILAVAVGIIGYGLQDMVRGLDALLLVPLAWLGLWVGWRLSGSRLKGGWVSLILVMLGALILIIIGGGLAGRILSLVGAFLTDIADYHDWIRGRLPDLQATGPAYLSLMQGLGAVYARISGWYAAVHQGGARFDPLIPTLVWGWSIWAASGWAGWSVKRGFKPIAIFLPYLLIFGGSLGVVRTNPVLLIPLLGCLLCLSPLINQVNREGSWERREVDYSLEIRFDLASTAIPLVFMIVGVAFLVYLVPWDQLFEPKPSQPAAASGQAENMASSFGMTLPTRVPTRLDPYLAPGLPLSHLIGSGPELTKQVAMRVSVLNQPGGPPASLPPLRWRAFTYDRYLGTGWATSGVEIVGFRAGEQVNPNAAQQGSQVSLRFDNAKPTAGIVYYAGQLITINQDFTVQRRSNGDIFAGYLPQNQYQVESTLSKADPQQLRQAGETYPEWVKNRYLALPENLPNRVISLALELTVPEQNPYDRAKAIETYLRTYPYTLDLPAPPQGRDIVDYFLFDLKKGYCDYYASAMVVLARVAGLPARLVVGYAGGEWDASRQEFVVHESDGHSWPEIYFPGYGWIEFEPTAGTPLGVSQANPNLRGPSFAQTPGGSAGPNGRGLDRIWQIPLAWTIAGLIPLLLILILPPILQDRRLRRLAPAEALTLIYQQMSRKKNAFQLSSEQSQTPLEFSAALRARLVDLGQRKWVGRLFRPGPGELETLVDLYVQSVYSPREITREAFGQKFSLWQRLRARLWVGRMIVRLGARNSV